MQLKIKLISVHYFYRNLLSSLQMAFIMQWNNNYTEDDDYEDDEFHEIALMVLFPRRRKVFQRRRNYFEVLNDDEFFDRFRLFKSTVMFVIDKIRNQIWN